MTAWRCARCGCDQKQSCRCVLVFELPVPKTVPTWWWSIPVAHPMCAAVQVSCVIISTVANLIVGASGYVLFQQQTEDNVLRNLSLSDPAADLVRALFGVPYAAQCVSRPGVS